MKNIILGYNNRVDAATLSGGSWSTGLPLTNLQSRIISKVARTTNTALASATVNVDLGASSAYPIGCVALVAHNLSATARVRITAGASSLANLLIDSSAFDTANWEKTQVTITSTTRAAPDGSATAREATQTASSGAVLAQIIGSRTGSYTFGVWARQTSGTTATMQLAVDGSVKYSKALTASWQYIATTATLSAGTKLQLWWISGGTNSTIELWEASLTAGAAPIYDSGWQEVWPSGVIPQSLLEWENTNFWLGTLSDEARAGFKSPYIVYNAARTIARHWQIQVSDTINSAGYVQVGRLFMSDVFQPTYNYGWLAQLGYQDPTAISRSLGGEEYFDQQTRYRTFKLKFEWLTQTEAHSNWLEMHRAVGTSGEVLVIPDLDDATTGIYRNFVGRFLSLSPITQLPSRRFSCDLEMRELI